MSDRANRMCARCQKRPVEIISGPFGDEGDFISDQCGHCNDRDIEQASERREWDHFHR